MAEDALTRYRALRSRLIDHPLYKSLDTIDALRVFMEHHVYAVWDFMSLIKSLQAQIAPTAVPWSPSDSPHRVRMINQMVLEEESDHDLADTSKIGFASHFESYCQAMAEVGADISPVKRFVDRVRNEGLEPVIQTADVPKSARRFMQSTFDMIRQGHPHQLAAMLAYGRESLVPGIFQSILAELQTGSRPASLLHRYLHRHVELDGGAHGALAVRLVEELCGLDTLKRRQAMDAAAEALQARNDFWDDIYQTMTTCRS